MEVNGSGGRLDRKTSKEKSVKKTSPTEKNIAGSVKSVKKGIDKKKREQCRSVKPGKPHARKYDFICSARLVRSGG